MSLWLAQVLDDEADGLGGVVLGVATLVAGGEGFDERGTATAR